MPKTARRRSRPVRAAKKAPCRTARPPRKEQRALTLAEFDPRDERALERWEKGMLQKGRTHLTRELRRLRDLGVLDENGKLIPKDLPPDMKPGSRAGV